MKTLKLILMGLAILLMPLAALAQTPASTDAAQSPPPEEDEGDADAPQILTSDLAPEQELDATSVQVSLVIVDDDNVTAVSINGQKVAVTPGDTVLIDRTFQLTKKVTVITVTATDQAGNSRTKTFTVFKPGARSETGELVAEEEELKPEIGFNFSVKYETDSNPTNDLSSGLLSLDVTGVVEDSQQEDTRTTLQGTGTVKYGDLDGFLGFQDASYGRSDNDGLNVQAILLGGGYTLKVSDTFQVWLRGTLTDLNIGGNDYSVNTTLQPSLVFLSDNGEEGTSRNILRLNIVSKDFASGEQTDGTDTVLVWRRETADSAKLDTFTNRLRYGTNTEGREESDFSFFSEDADWQNRWEFGLRFDLGFGIARRDYPNDTPLTTDTPLGTTRNDFLLRYSFGVGWQIKPDWSVMYNYRTVNNLSNKSPYERTISGLVLQGAF